MARIRTIKPEFWTSAQVMECSANARLMFIGMWNFADDCGRMTFSPKTIKAQVFPADNFALDDITGMLSELSKNGLIVRYAVEGIEYLYITGWHHQRIDKPQKPKHPEPIKDHSKNDTGTFSPVSYPSQEESIGKERKQDAASAASDPSIIQREYYIRGKEVCGETSGGILTRLAKAKGGNYALARAVVEVASTKQNAREYIAAAVHGPPSQSRPPDV